MPTSIEIDSTVFSSSDFQWISDKIQDLHCDDENLNIEKINSRAP